MSLKDANWQDVETGSVGDPTEPRLTVRPGREGYINKAADQLWFGDAEYVRFQVDPEQHLLRLIPETEESGKTVRLVREYDYGAEVSLKSTLRHFGIHQDDFIDEAEYIDIQNLGDGVLVADLASLFANDDDGEDDADPVQEAVDEVNEPAEDVAEELAEETEEIEADLDDEDGEDDGDAKYYGSDPRSAVRAWAVEKVSAGDEYMLESREIAAEIEEVSSRQVGQHLGQLRDDEDFDEVAIEREDRDEWTRARWRLSPGVGEKTVARNGSGDVDLSAVIQAADNNTVESVHELADHLGFPEKPDRARTLAMKAGVYPALQDAPKQGGYGRPGGE